MGFKKLFQGDLAIYYTSDHMEEPLTKFVSLKLLRTEYFDILFH